MSVYYNEIDPYCCRVLRKQIATGNLPEGFVDERDVREVQASDLAGYRQIHLFAGIGGFPLGLKWAGVPDDFSIITGGFPCQDISYANSRGKGIDGERSGLWFEFSRIIRLVRPRYILVENTPALLTRGIHRVLGSLAESGYDAAWQIVPAAAFGAPHLRERIFIVAYPDRQRCEELDVSTVTATVGQSHRFSHEERIHVYPDRVTSWPVGRPWEAEPDVGRVADGIPARVDRLGGLGNAVVPQCVEWLGRLILEHHNGTREP